MIVAEPYIKCEEGDGTNPLHDHLYVDKKRRESFPASQRSATDTLKRGLAEVTLKPGSELSITGDDKKHHVPGTYSGGRALTGNLDKLRDGRNG